MLSYVPADTLAYRLDPRTKLGAQIAFAAVAFTSTAPRALLWLTGVVVLVLMAARVHPIGALSSLRFPIVLLVVAPILEGLTLGPPWFSPAAAWGPALAAYRVVLILLVSAAYVRTTPVRETRAAIEWALPGRVGRFLGVGTGLVLRSLPMLRADFHRSRDAVRSRLGDRRRLDERMRVLALAGLRRAVERADRLGLALRARCFSWNPTGPVLRFSRLDGTVWLGIVGLLATALL